MKDQIQFRVRALSAEDVGVMRSMLAMFGDAFEDRDTYTKMQPDEVY